MNTPITKQINSHIYFPEFMVKSFYGNKEIKYLNAKSKTVLVAADSNVFNAQPEWFTLKNENILNKESEQKFQQLSLTLTKKVRGKNQELKNIEINPCIIYKFFTYQFIRDRDKANLIFSEAQKRGAISGTIKTLQEFENIFIETEKSEELIYEVLSKSFKIVVVLNYTPTDFIAVNAPVAKTFQDDKIYILVSSPKVSWCLMSNDAFNVMHTDKISCVTESASIEYVSYVNESIMTHAMTHEPGFVIGKDLDYMQRLRENIRTKNKNLGL